MIETTHEAILEAAANCGLQLKKLATGLYSVEKTWCPVLISCNTGQWVMEVQQRSNRNRRWRVYYRGPRLSTALTKAKNWLDPEKAPND